MNFSALTPEHNPTTERRAARKSWIAAGCVAMLIGAPGASAQTDYYSTDKGRPLTIEDAYPTERYAFEAQIAPIRLERSKGGSYRWTVEPEVAYGILPRTHLEIGVPLSYVDAGSGTRRFGVAGVDISALHNFNVETATLPALAILGNVLLPAGRFGPDRAIYSATGAATRTFRSMRVHLNGTYAFGDNIAEEVETPRWLGGISADRTFPLRSMLIGAEVFAQRPLTAGASVNWNAATGIRYQLNPHLIIDGGIGKQLNGDERKWFVTLGLSRAFAVRSLFPTA